MKNIYTISAIYTLLGNLLLAFSFFSICIDASLERKHHSIFNDNVLSIPIECKVDTCVNLSISTVTSCRGEQVCVEVQVQNFTAIASMQGSLSFDPNFLQFEQFQQLNLPDLTAKSFYTGDVENGRLAFAWFDRLLGGVSLSDSSSVFQICFTAIQNGQTSINLTNSPIIIEVADVSEIKCVDTHDGVINIQDSIICAPDSMETCVNLSITSGTFCQEEQFCVDITVQNFVAIAAIQASLNFDADVLAFQKIQGFNFDLSPFNNGNFNTQQAINGVLAFAWFDPYVEGISLIDNSVIFQLCFKALKNGHTEINFTNSPIQIEITDFREVKCVTTNMGTINISESNDCNCDYYNLTLNENPIFPEDYTVRDNITSSGTVAKNTIINLQAGNTILLSPGFTVKPNAIFSAKIASCAPVNFREAEPEFELRQIDLENNFSFSKEPINLKIQPNPFRYQTTLVLNLAKLERVNLKVFDQSGRMLKELLKNEILSAGKHEIELSGDLLQGGLYYISFQTETEHLMKKAIVISDGRVGIKNDDD